jgi:hypothetical protein
MVVSLPLITNIKKEGGLCCLPFLRSQFLIIVWISLALLKNKSSEVVLDNWPEACSVARGGY